MPNWNSVPWTQNELIDLVFLTVSCLIVTAVPVVYGIRANLRDGLARAVLAGTGSTAFVFNLTLGFTLAYHAGWQPSTEAGHWIARGVYLTVALGKLLLLIALLRVVRSSRWSNYEAHADKEHL